MAPIVLRLDAYFGLKLTYVKHSQWIWLYE